MSSNGSKRLEAWLVVAGMVAALVWYASPQLVYMVMSLQQLVELARHGAIP